MSEYIDPPGDHRAILIVLDGDCSVEALLADHLATITRQRPSRSATVVFQHGIGGLCERYRVELLDPTIKDTKEFN